MATVKTIKTNLKKKLPSMVYPEMDEDTDNLRRTQLKNIARGNAMAEAEKEAGLMWKRERKFYYWHP